MYAERRTPAIFTLSPYSAMLANFRAAAKCTSSFDPVVLTLRFRSCLSFGSYFGFFIVDRSTRDSNISQDFHVDHFDVSFDVN